MSRLSRRAWATTGLAISSVTLSFLLSGSLAAVLAGPLVGAVESQTLLNLLFGLLVYLIMLASLAAIWRWYLRRPLAEIGLGRPSQWQIVAYLPLLALAYYSLSVLINGLLILAVPQLADSPAQQLGFTPEPGLDLLYAGLLLLVAAPLAEELVFRGYLYGLLRRYLSFKVTTAIVSLMFGLAHLFNDGNVLWILAADTAALSLFLCWLREKSGSVWPGVLLHSLKNSVAFALLFIISA